ncbi:MAG: DUF1294 domain-containing protein [Lachnospiraceae bacterium]|nr:DUF1294 domain-containing protein [Lachnospiraceae bacterium]
MAVLRLIALYLVAINLAGFLAFFIDKSRSIRAKWRIPESTLLSFAFFGGGVGCFLGMRIFHHKTLKPKFYIGIPAIIVFHILLVLFLIYLSPYKFVIQ